MAILPNLRKRAYRGTLTDEKGELLPAKMWPSTVWSNVDFSWWGSLSAMRPNRWLEHRERPIGGTIEHDPWWKRLWRWAVHFFLPTFMQKKRNRRG